MRLPIFHVDAFADRPFTGNPAAVCPLNAWLDDELLRGVAAENNLSETAFFVPRNQHYELRWFTPRCEVKLCGHGTLASAHVILNRIEPASHSVRFETRQSGPLTVTKEGDLFSMDFPAMFAKPCPNPPNELLHALAGAPAPLRVLEINSKYIAVYEHEDSIRNLQPDFALLDRLHPFTVAVTAPGREVDFVSRYFAPSYGVQEDPVTGSSHCALTPYWAKELGKASLTARQLSSRGGSLSCGLSGNRVILQGKAVFTLEGLLQI